ncbi:MAG: glycosyltransferase [candidate division Zixibacteria bacterium]|nr:glycosyltransferase [candidate division Zixibacteria bacterium]
MSAHRLKILVLADSRSFHIERLARELVRQGCRVVTASLERGRLCHYKLKRRGPVKAWHYPLSAPEVKSIIRKYRPDVINPHYACGYGFSTALAVGKGGPPVVLDLWGSDILIVPRKSFFHRAITRTALRRADLVLGDSQYLLSAAEALARPARKSVVRWGIERQYLEFHRSDYELRRPLRIIVPRPHEEVYNNGFILRALAPLIVKEDVEITFPDFGSQAGEFRAEGESLVGGKVKFYPRMSRYEFMRFMAGFDVYLSAARSDSSPVSLIEAMGLGLIPIAADIPGISEWLTKASGYRFRQDSADGLRAVIEGLLSEKDPHERMRRGNFERVRREAVFEHNVAERIRLMHGLAEGADG